jgi:spermidine synthase
MTIEVGRRTAVAAATGAFDRLLPLLLAFTLTLTGASGLMYQVIWFRALGLTFGVTVQATSAVLAAFMSGLAIGSLAASRFADRVRNPLRLYALIEIVVGLTGFASLLAFDAVQPVYRSLAPLWSETPGLVPAIRFVLAFAIMLIPTTLMGATLPLVVRAADSGGFAPRNVGLLYAANTFGAVAGAFLAGFYFIGVFGLTGTTAIAAGFNLLAGLVWLAVSRDRSEPIGSTGTVGPGETIDEQPLSPKIARGVLIAYGISGLIALAYEVVWTRVLAGIFPGNVYAFTLMLCAILTGIALGSWLVTPFLVRRWNWLLVFAGLELLLAVVGVISILTLANAYTFEAAVRGWLGMRDGNLLPEPLFMALFGLLAIGPSALIMGALFPVAARLIGAGHEDVAHRVGQVYGVNVIGAIAGSLLGGLALIPLVGAERALWLLALGNALIGLAFFAALFRRVLPRALAAGFAVGIVVLAVSTPGLLYDRLFATIPWNERTLWYQEGPDATIRVAQYYGDGARVLYVNSEHQGTDHGSGLEFHHRLGHLGL